MKIFSLSSICIFLSLLSEAQDFTLKEFNTLRVKKEQRSMIALGSWGVANVIAGAGFASQSDGSNKYFHMMNIGWGVVNLSIASFGYFRAKRTDLASMGLQESIDDQHKLEKILLLNTGLDIGYVMGGLYLLERSNRSDVNQNQLKGFGQSIILQGVFLFVFDLTTYLVHNSNHKSLKKIVGSLTLSNNQLGLVFYY